MSGNLLYGREWLISEMPDSDSDFDSDLIDDLIDDRKTFTIVVHSESFPPSTKVVSVEHERVLTEYGAVIVFGIRSNCVAEVCVQPRKCVTGPCGRALENFPAYANVSLRLQDIS